MAEPILFQQPDVTSLDKSKKLAIGKAGAITENITITAYETQLDTALGLPTIRNNVSTNTSNIASNTSAIATNTSNIATNTSNIATNTSNIVTNTSNIASNTSAISSLTTRMTTAEGDIDALQAAISVDDWHQVGGVGEPQYNTNWTAGNNPLCFRKSAAKTVHITGEVVTLGAVSGLVWRLPAGYRPYALMYGIAWSYNSVTPLKISIDTDGYFNIVSTPGAFWIDIQFKQFN